MNIAVTFFLADLHLYDTVSRLEIAFSGSALSSGKMDQVPQWVDKIPILLISSGINVQLLLWCSDF